MIIVNNKTIDLNQFPDGTLLVKFSEVASTFTIEWKYENDAELFALICISRHLRRVKSHSHLYLENALPPKC